MRHRGGGHGCVCVCVCIVIFGCECVKREKGKGNPFSSRLVVMLANFQRLMSDLFSLMRNLMIRTCS